MSAKNQIYALAATSLVLAASTAFFAYKNFTVKNQLAGWYKSQGDQVKGSLPAEIQDMLNKALS